MVSWGLDLGGALAAQQWIFFLGFKKVGLGMDSDRPIFFSLPDCFLKESSVKCRRCRRHLFKTLSGLDSAAAAKKLKSGDAKKLRSMNFYRNFCITHWFDEF